MLIGICGKSGSGKSTICRCLEALGAYVIDADVIGKNITNGSVLEEVRDLFPDCFEDGVLNRKKLGTLVFNDSEKLEALNSVTHPAIRKEIELRIDSVKNEYKYIVVDAAVMIEAGMLDMFDFTVSVVAGDEIRIKRIMDRDGITQRMAYDRINAQNPDDYYAENTDFCVVNNGDVPADVLAMEILDRSRIYETTDS